MLSVFLTIHYSAVPLNGWL